MPLGFKAFLKALFSPEPQPVQVPLFRRPAPRAPRRQEVGFVPLGLAMRSSMARDPSVLRYRTASDVSDQNDRSR
jgi:hypothetical protein